ncbi:MAG: shikimate kinase [Chlamydiales bacterium]|nr:shikimate kinase [Chlamydiales bacterium]
MILCGLFCAGKSTLGAGAADRMGLPFYDTDRLLEAAYGKSVSALWQELGENAFRDLETAIVLSLKKEPSVIATGGGTLLREENRVHLKEMGRSVYLKVPVEILWKRLQKRGRPAYIDPASPFEHLERIAKERIPIFEAYCDCVFENQTSIELSIEKLIYSSIS